MIEINLNNLIPDGKFNILEPLDVIAKVYQNNLGTGAYCLLLYGKEYQHGNTTRRV